MQYIFRALLGMKSSDKKMNISFLKWLGFHCNKFYQSVKLQVDMEPSTSKSKYLGDQNEGNCKVKAEKQVCEQILSHKNLVTNSKAKKQYLIGKKKLMRKRSLRIYAKSKLQSQKIKNCTKSILFERKRVLKIQKSDNEQNAEENEENEEKSQERSSLSVSQAFEKYLNEQIEEMSCPVCNTDLIEPVVTPCGHVFCLQCIQKCMMRVNSCPLCRELISQYDNYGIGSSKLLKVLASKMNKTRRKNDYAYLCEQNQQWKKKRFVSEDQILKQQRYKLDVWSHSGSWKAAQVRDVILNNQNHISELFITYSSNPFRKEIVEFPSLKVARAGFYSQQPKAQFPLFSNVIGQILLNPEADSLVFAPGAQYILGLQNEEGRNIILRPSTSDNVAQLRPEIEFVQSQEIIDYSIESSPYSIDEPEEGHQSIAFENSLAQSERSSMSNLHLFRIKRNQSHRQ